MTKKTTTNKQLPKKAMKKKAHSRASKKHETIASKTTPCLVARCPSCGASVSLDGSSAHEIVECQECTSSLEVLKKGSRLRLSIDHSDPGDDFPPSD